MAYYDALVSAWATLPAGDTTAQKLAAINALTVAGPNRDVPVGDVVGYLALQGKLSTLQAYALSGSGTPAFTAAKEMVTLLSTPSVTSFRTSDAATAAAVQGFLSALAADPASGVASADVTALLEMAATTVPWWQSAGYTSPIGPNDLIAAGGLT